jgi:hypothetical protein
MGADGGRDNAATKPSSTTNKNDPHAADEPSSSNSHVAPDTPNEGERQVTPEKKESTDRTNSPPAPTQSFAHPYGYHTAHLTPQPASGYYHNVSYQTQQMTPEPPSPAGAVYDMGSFFHQQAAFAPLNSPFGASGQYHGGLQPPLSPTRTFSSGSMVIPPASPLFPRVSSAGLGSVSFEQQQQQQQQQQQRSQLDSRSGANAAGTPLSPNVPYLSSALGSAVYQGYGNNGNTNSQNNSSDDITGWGDRYVGHECSFCYHTISRVANS